MDDILFDNTIKSAISIINHPTLFKYFDLNTGLKVLQNQNLVFSRPDRFNDPFDCSIELIKVDADAIRKHMSGVIVRDFKSNYSERYRLKRQLDKANDQQVLALSKSGLSFDYSRRGITCFSTSFNEILMWAHYCKNHNGICIGYDTVKLYSFLRNHVYEIGYFPVDYVDHLDKKSLYPVNSEAILYMLKTKSDIWRYEKEVRITGTNFNFNEDHVSFIKLPQDIITHIYIGINVPQSNTDEAVKFAKILNPDLVIFKMQADYTSFNLIPYEL